MLVNQGRCKDTDPMQRKFDDGVLDYIIEDLRPFNAVSGSGFRKLISLANPRLTVKDRTTYARRLPQRLEEVQRKVADKLAESKDNILSASFTSDMWTSRANDSFLSLTIHYVDEDFILRHFVLHCDPFEGTHDSDSIAKTLDEQIGSLDLPSCCEGKKIKSFRKISYQCHFFYKVHFCPGFRDKYRQQQLTK